MDCSRCNGKGAVRFALPLGPANGRPIVAYHMVSAPCGVCLGTGREHELGGAG